MIKKYAVGLLIFGVYYLIWRNVENRVSAVKNLTNLGGGTPTAS